MEPERKDDENLSSCLRLELECLTDPGEHEQPKGSMKTVAEHILFSETGNRLATVICICDGFDDLGCQSRV